MPSSTRSRLRTSTFITVAIAAAFLAACSSSGSNSMKRPTNKRSKEYFSEAAYGVKASPRVTNKRSRLPRGGGRDQLGRPYKVAGKWYYPKEDKNYRKSGAASWYGDAFHGRLTANGEIYDMTHLTAAHPTMPLPSYARVTNLKNGSSIIVRVNDRGPYARGRIIDLSKRAAEMLDYTHSGVAKVKVEYVGRAPLDGRDDSYLVASYRPGRGVDGDTLPGNDGLASGVMVAMNGPSPSRSATDAVADIFSSDEAANASAVAYSTGPVDLPAFGPIFPDRPVNDIWPAGNQQVALNVMSYADSRVKQAATPFDALDNGGLSDDEVAAWKRQNPGAGGGRDDYVAAGTFSDKAEAERVAAALHGTGRVSIERSEEPTGTWYSVEVRSDGRPLDDILQAAWDSGATDALAVRD
jgi:rare lipoprotein A